MKSLAPPPRMALHTLSDRRLVESIAELERFARTHPGDELLPQVRGAVVGARAELERRGQRAGGG